MELVYYIAACSHRDLYLIPLPANDLTSGTGLQKREGILKNFEKEISGKKGDDNSICDLLKRQTVQDLYYLRAGLKDRIFSCRAGGMTTMSIREEEYLDMEIKYYERLLTLTNRYIPEEDER